MSGPKSQVVMHLKAPESLGYNCCRKLRAWTFVGILHMMVSANRGPVRNPREMWALRRGYGAPYEEFCTLGNCHMVEWDCAHPSALCK